MPYPSGQTLNRSGRDLPTVNPNTVPLRVDTITECLLMTTEGLIVPSILVIELCPVEGLLKEAQVPWIAVTTAEVIPGSMTNERCEHLLGTQGDLLSVVLLNGSRQETRGTTETLEMTASDLITEGTLYHLLWNPEEHLRAQVYRKSTGHTNATFHHQGTKAQTDQRVYRPDLCLPFHRHLQMAPQSIPLVQL